MSVDLVSLAQKANSCAKQVSSILRQAITDEASSLSAEGFVVPSKESLRNAAKVFDALYAMRGGGYAIGDDADTAEQRLDMVCAFATSLQGLEDEFDLSWSNTWAITTATKEPTGVEFSDALGKREAMQVLVRWNAGQREALLSEMRIACQRYEMLRNWNR